ncbi:transposase-like protein [Phyllobacterium ifriqiyense]|uniref:Transposase-like protein n=1 Tax=Phyllobacterium ifriqiyense TaxID=314238 RepID=A0ABU0S6D7_9HYPH|nr:transposase-like protein [Phyllobacterium ifriqiyense]
MNEVAGWYGLKANYLLSWRTLARQGKLVLPEAADTVESAIIVTETPAPESPTAKAISRAEIVVG